MRKAVFLAAALTLASAGFAEAGHCHGRCHRHHHPVRATVRATAHVGAGAVRVAARVASAPLRLLFGGCCCK